MSLKKKLSERFLNNSKSFNYYKTKYHNLSKENKKIQKEIHSLSDSIRLKNNNLFEIKNALYDIEEGFVFSIVIAIYNTEKYLSEAIDSIINQTFDFRKVQIILVNDGSTVNCKEICKDYVNKYPNNIFYLYQDNNGQASARNNGLRLCEGKYVNFLDSDDKLELNALEEVYFHFLKYGEEIDVISIPRYLFGAVDGPMNYHHRFNKNRVVDINEEYDFPQVSISAAFIRKSAISENFDERVIISEDSLLINSIILKKCKFGVVGSTKYLYRKRYEHNSTIDSKKIKKEYFNPRMKFYFKKLINISIELHGVVLKYIQVVLMYDLQWLFIQNTEYGVLSENDANEFYQHIFDVLQVIDDDLILLDSFSFSKFLRYHIFKYKYINPNFEIKYDDLKLLYHDKIFDVLSNYMINITNIDKIDDLIVVKGFFEFYPWNIDIKVYSGDKPCDISMNKEYVEFSTGKPVSIKINFESSIPLNDISDLRFEIYIGSISFISKLNYSKTISNLKFNRENKQELIIDI